jgi:DNA-binding transcriptional ArsR family regulator
MCRPPYEPAAATTSDWDAVAAVAAALAAPARLRLVRELAAAAGGLGVADLTARAGLTEPAAAPHLRLLVAAGLARRPGGTSDRYAPTAGVVSAGRLVRVRVGGSVPSYGPSSPRP